LGNSFHRELVEPAVQSLLGVRPGERVLDVACGTGVMARRLASWGATVTAVDFSPALIERAQARGGEIDYRVVDATDEAALLALGAFDAIVCTMALMDMPVIAPLYRAVAQMLSTQGRFVFATAHPAFNSNNPVFLTEIIDHDGLLEIVHGLKISAYLGVPPTKAVGSVDEPNPHPYYHRPLSELVAAAFEAGLVLDGLNEVAFPPEQATPDRIRFWVNMPQIPPVLAGRLRKRSA
ncbi:MAG: methyltransferase domain-containing protein, partial [Chloroflexi bacterium]|nr:methyltransferase domain-containing protein [Chloroflexota bacterium]